MTSSSAAGPRADGQRGYRPGRRIAGIAVLFAALLLAVTVGRGSSGDDSASSVAFDSETGALAFELETFDGTRLDSRDLAGTPLVLNGYASWCRVCEREMPDFERVHRAVGSHVAIVGFNPQSNDTDQAQAELVRRTEVTYPTVRDPGDRLLREFNPTGGLPVTVFVDADGVVRKVHRGLLTERLLLDELRRTLGLDV